MQNVGSWMLDPGCVSSGFDAVNLKLCDFVTL